MSGGEAVTHTWTGSLGPNQRTEVELPVGSPDFWGGDGQNFFDTAHPVGDGVTLPITSVANTDGGSGAAWFLLDTSRAVRPFIWQLRQPYQLVRKDQPSDDNVFMNKEYIYGTDARCNVGVGLW